jgi:hypothetical protein
MSISVLAKARYWALSRGQMNRVPNSSVGIGTDWIAGVRFPVGTGDFSLLHRVQTGSETNPASYPMGTGNDLSWTKAAGA